MQNTTKKSGKKIPGTANSQSYLELIQSFPPRRINSEEELKATQEIIDGLLDCDSLTKDERDYLHLLGLVVSEYEDKHYLIPDIYGIDLLKVMMEEFNLKPKDLIDIFETELITSEVLAGQRQLTINQVQKLADFFHVSPSVFFQV